MTELLGRLGEIARMVPPDTVLYDVGCDHGHVPISLISSGRIPFAVASDLREGPLLRAKENAGKEGVWDRMEFFCSDGLREVPLRERGGSGNTLLITGMGGKEILKILTEGKEKLPFFSGFLFSPQSQIAEFRKGLKPLRIRITDESLVLDGGKHYFLIFCIHGEDACLSRMDYELGPFFFQKKDEAHRTWLEKRLGTLEGLLAGRDIPGTRREELAEELALYRKAVMQYEMP
ncbi:MAG: class I SAM-dependent methyltransferase [Lachnospiraceae bacterium]|nr:class I SAM-dependent methyltransferase [Lachnospiraceae bacterium]